MRTSSHSSVGSVPSGEPSGGSTLRSNTSAISMSFSTLSSCSCIPSSMALCHPGPTRSFCVRGGKPPGQSSPSVASWILALSSSTVSVGSTWRNIVVLARFTRTYIVCGMGDGTVRGGKSENDSSSVDASPRGEGSRDGGFGVWSGGSIEGSEARTMTDDPSDAPARDLAPRSSWVTGTRLQCSFRLHFCRSKTSCRRPKSLFLSSAFQQCEPRACGGEDRLLSSERVVLRLVSPLRHPWGSRPFPWLASHRSESPQSAEEVIG